MSNGVKSARFKLSLNLETLQLKSSKIPENEFSISGYSGNSPCRRLVSREVAHLKKKRIFYLVSISGKTHLWNLVLVGGVELSGHVTGTKFVPFLEHFHRTVGSWKIYKVNEKFQMKEGSTWSGSPLSILQLCPRTNGSLRNKIDATIDNMGAQNKWTCFSILPGCQHWKQWAHSCDLK